MKNKLSYVITATALLGMLSASGVALAAGPGAGDNGQQGQTGGRWGGGMTGGEGKGMMGGDSKGMMRPGVFGTVASVSGNTFSVTSKRGPNNTGTTTYSVDATNAKVMKSGTTSTMSAVLVGDTVMVQGTVTGTSVVATDVRDGMPQGGRGGRNGGPNGMSMAQGNGQPVIGGNVTAINGTTLTIVNRGSQTYTVDASSSTVNKAGASSTVSAIAVGDSVVVQGTITGNSVVAASISDRGVRTAPQQGGVDNGQNQNDQNQNGHEGFRARFMGAIGGFFHRFFGFF